MKRRISSVFLSAVIFFGGILLNAMEISATGYWPEGPELQTPCAIVMEVETGTVLFEKNVDEQHYPASITKIMTAMLAIENSDLDEVVTFSQDAVYKTEGSGIARDVGEEMTMEECLYGMMLNSSNECAYAIAEHVGGTYDAFIVMMNDKARELGCENTHFNNPHGLPDESHITTCRDMALIARAAFQSETFRIIVGTPRYTIPPTNKHDEPTYLQNHNEMLYPWKSKVNYQYEYCVGGKTGYTEVARHTLVTYAQKDGMTLVCVVMNTGTPYHWTESTQLFNFCFDNFQVWDIAENETQFQDEDKNTGMLNQNAEYIQLDGEGVIVLPKTASFKEAESQIVYDDLDENVIAKVDYTYGERTVGSIDIVRSETKIEEFNFVRDMANTQQPDEAEENGKVFRINPLKILLVVLSIVGLGLLLLLLKYLYENFYIIRHRIQSDRARKNNRKYKTIKNTRSYNRRGGFRRGFRRRRRRR